MVAPHDQVAQQISQAEPCTKREFRNLRRDRHKRDASTRRAQHRHQQLAKPRGNSKPLRAGRRSGRPLRGGFVSMRGISGAEPGTERDFRNIRRDRHKRDASTRQAQHRHQQLAKPRGNSKPLRAGRRSGRPLRGGFVSMRGISGAEPGTERDFRNIRRDRHKRDTSTRQAQHRHQQIPFPYRHARADAAVRGFHVTASAGGRSGPPLHRESMP